MFGLKKLLKSILIANLLNCKKRLITATTEPNDVVLDPAAGGFSVYDSCIETGRLFLGCDLVFGDEKLKEKSGDFLCAA